MCLAFPLPPPPLILCSRTRRSVIIILALGGRREVTTPCHDEPSSEHSRERGPLCRRVIGPPIGRRRCVPVDTKRPDEVRPVRGADFRRGRKREGGTTLMLRSRDDAVAATSRLTGNRSGDAACLKNSFATGGECPACDRLRLPRACSGGSFRWAWFALGGLGIQVQGQVQIRCARTFSSSRRMMWTR